MSNQAVGNRNAAGSALQNITPSDTVSFAATSKIYLTVAGDIHILTRRDNYESTPTKEVTLTLVVGWHDIQATRIFSTDTTATGIIASW